jgi:DNA-binding response OmpR family regulator
MKKVLVIEDNTEVQDNITEILELEGFDVLHADNGSDGLDIAIEKLPDIILCDIMMPKVKGYEVLQQLKANAPTASIPFIFLTALSERSEQLRGMGLGADGYLIKPFEMDVLLNEIERCLKTV